MSAEKYQEAVTALMQQRPCPEGFSLADSPEEQTLATIQVIILDRKHHYFSSHTRGTQADCGQVDSPDHDTGPIHFEPTPTSLHPTVHEHSPPSHSTRHCRKRPMHYPWQWVSPQLLNSKGEQIFYPVVDDIDRSWARRLEWAINSHRDLAEADLNALQAEFERVLRTSREAVGRRDDRLYIKSLEEQLASAHQRFRELRRL